MFNQCHELKQIEGTGNFNTAKVTTMEAMVQECKELVYLVVTNFNTSNVTDMG
jgi:surface protein